MYKVRIEQLKALKKQLIANNKLLDNLRDELNDVAQEAVDKQISRNEKQIKILTDEYYID